MHVEIQIQTIYDVTPSNVSWSHKILQFLQMNSFNEITESL